MLEKPSRADAGLSDWAYPESAEAPRAMAWLDPIAWAAEARGGLRCGPLATSSEGVLGGVEGAVVDHGKGEGGPGADVGQVDPAGGAGTEVVGS